MNIRKNVSYLIYLHLGNITVKFQLPRLFQQPLPLLFGTAEYISITYIFGIYGNTVHFRLCKWCWIRNPGKWLFGSFEYWWRNLPSHQQCDREARWIVSETSRGTVFIAAFGFSIQQIPTRLPWGICHYFKCCFMTNIIREVTTIK